MRARTFVALLVLGAGFLAVASPARSTHMSPTVVGQANVFVDGQANIFLAGRSFVPPDTDGILPPVVPLGGSHTVLFGSVEGTFSCCGGAFPNGPDGGDRSMFPGCCDNPPYRGISGLRDFTPRGGYLVGVFLDGTEPADPPPPSLDFTRNYDFSDLSPLLRQVFFIGDGRDASRTQQRFHAPAGATRLFLGQVDGQGEYFDNTGGFTASLITAVPTARCDQTIVIRGTSGPDTLVGTPADEKFIAGAGDDHVLSDGGEDCLLGQAGDDTLRGGPQDDQVRGGTGNDRIRGGHGNDILRGGLGDDRITANDGEPDQIDCGGGIDTAIVDTTDSVSNCEVVIVRPPPEEDMGD